MAFTHKVLQELTVSGRSVSSENTYSGDGQASIEVAVPDESSDMLVDLALDVSQIASIIILADQVLTLETNDGDTPDDTISLVANVPYVWNSDSYDDCPLTVDVTALYVTNASGSAATLKIECVYDATPS